MCGDFDATDGLDDSHVTNGNEVSPIISDRWQEECVEHFQKLTAEQRAYKIIHTYFQLENPTDEMRDRFIVWFLDDRNRAAKDRAMERMFVEVLDCG